MEKIKLTIDDQEVEVEAGKTVLEAARAAGISIPTLCYHPAISPWGGCRLCIVEIAGMRTYPPACTTPAAPGMIVRTNTPKLQELRQTILELILTEHPHVCLFCERQLECKRYHICLQKSEVTTGCTFCAKNKRCELQKVVEQVGLKEMRLPFTYKNLPVDRSSPFFDRDPNLCILCGRCVRVCEEVRGASAISFVYRGSQALIGTAFDRPLQDSGCQFCGACVDICPTGALIERMGRWQGLPDREVATICPYCGVGCQLKLEVKGERVLRVSPDPEGPVNHGQACVKGRFGIAQFIHHPDRLSWPLVWQDGERVETPWDEALDLVASRLSQYKGDEVVVIASAKATNEDNYLAQKLARAVLKTNHIDHCARL